MRAAWYEEQGPALDVIQSGEIPTPELPFYPMMMKNAQLRWVFMYKIPDAAVVQAFRDISTWLAAGPSEHLVGRVFPHDETAAAHEFLESGQSTGTVVIAMDV